MRACHRRQLTSEVNAREVFSFLCELDLPFEIFFFNMSSQAKRRLACLGVIGLVLLTSPFLIKAENESTDEDLDELDELLAADREVEEEELLLGSKTSGVSEVASRSTTLVLELNNDNTHKVVSDNEYVLVLVYAPWCGRSAEIMPHFVKAANSLKDMSSPLLLVKLDAERHAKAASSLGVKGFPTLLLFVNGTAQRYTGGFTGDEIVIWARKKTGAPVIRLSSKHEAEDFLRKHHTFVIGFFENFKEPFHAEFVQAAISHNELQFVESGDVRVAEFLYAGILSRSHFIGLVKNEPDRLVPFEDAFEADKILQFVEENKFPLVTVLTENNAARVHAVLTKLQVFTFAEVDDYPALLPFLQSVAGKFKSKLMFVYVDRAQDNLAKPLLTLFGLEPEEPIVLAYDYKLGLKYLLEKKLTTSSLDEFCSGLITGTISPYYKSEPTPTASGVVHKVVGRTFESAVLKSSENVLLEVYTPWCITCDATSKQVEKLAKHSKGETDLIFARIDASSNEHPELKVDEFPTLLFFPSGDKSNPIKLPAKSSLKELAAHINSSIGKTARDEL